MNFQLNHNIDIFCTWSIKLTPLHLQGGRTSGRFSFNLSASSASSPGGAAGTARRSGRSSRDAVRGFHPTSPSAFSRAAPCPSSEEAGRGLPSVSLSAFSRSAPDFCSSGETRRGFSPASLSAFAGSAPFFDCLHLSVHVYTGPGGGARQAGLRVRSGTEC